MNLNSQQLAAVEHVDGPLLILAGAGTGKTRVITERAVNLVRRHGVPAANILCVTFTNKAANEMRERISQRLGLGGDATRESATPYRMQTGGMTISTFHSLSAQILRQFPERVGLRRDFSIYTESEQLSIVRVLLRDLGEANRKPDMVHAKISRAKSEGRSPLVDDEFGQLAAALFEGYNRRLRQCNAVDFDDLLILTLNMLETYPDVREHYRQQFLYVQVDEYQDTNAIQVRLLRELIGPRRNICVVGDDDQSIYAWRGAQVRNILEFEKAFGRATVVRLEQNYRSTAAILAAANAVIQRNPVRAQKTLVSHRGQGEPLRLLAVADEVEEARAVLDMIESRKALGARFNECAVLFRTALLTRVFEEQARQRKIPYTLIGGQKFFERKEVKDVMCYLSLLVNDTDDAALLRVVNWPPRGIGEVTVDALATVAKQRRVSLARAMRGATVEELVRAGSPESGAQALFEFANAICELRAMVDNGALAPDIAEAVIERFKFEEALQREYAKDPSEPSRRMMNVRGTIESLRAFCSDPANGRGGGCPTLSDYIERMALVDAQDDADKASKLGRDAVVFITIHSCKGLEFRHVFLVAVEEGILPHKKAEAESESGLDEERRLAYVAMTRAMDSLTLTYTQSRQKYGRSQTTVPSRFLKEIPTACLESPGNQADRAARFRDFLDRLNRAVERQ